MPDSSRYRSPIKAEALLNSLRSLVISGDFKPGERLPPRPELVRRFGVANATLQVACHRLIAEGFLESRGRHGTYVAEFPPSSYRLALWLPPAGEEWLPGFGAVLRDAMRKQDLWPGFRMDTLDGGDEPAAAGAALIRRYGDGLYAGLIYAGSLDQLKAQSWARSFRGSTVVFGERGSQPPAGTGAVEVHSAALTRRVMDHLRRSGRRRIALVTSATDDAGYRQWVTAIAEAGLEHRPYWRQSADPASATALRTSVHCLGELAPANRPDALVVTDERLLEDASCGLIAAGIDLIDAMDVVSIGLLPRTRRDLVSVHWVGFDIAALLNGALQCVAELQSDPQCAPVRLIAPAMPF